MPGLLICRVGKRGDLLDPVDPLDPRSTNLGRSLLSLSVPQADKSARNHDDGKDRNDPLGKAADVRRSKQRRYR